MPANPTHHICPECFYTWEHGRDGSHSCVQQLRRYRLPADLRLPGGMTIARGCELNTVLLALRHREAGEAWQTSFDVPIPVDGQLQQLIRALPTQPPTYMAGAPLLSTAARDVLAERTRQITAEGWTPEHDDRNGSCELAAAAATYATCTEPEQLQISGAVAWPWRRGWWKPTTYRQNLVKAGALILAEIERLDRANAPLQELPVGIDNEGGSHD